MHTLDQDGVNQILGAECYCKAMWQKNQPCRGRMRHYPEEFKWAHYLFPITWCVDIHPTSSSGLHLLDDLWIYKTSRTMSVVRWHTTHCPREKKSWKTDLIWENRSMDTTPNKSQKTWGFMWHLENRVWRWTSGNVVHHAGNFKQESTNAMRHSGDSSWYTYRSTLRTESCIWV